MQLWRKPHTLLQPFQHYLPCCDLQVGFSTPRPNILIPLNYAIDIIFAIDICFNYRTAYYDRTATLVRDVMPALSIKNC